MLPGQVVFPGPTGFAPHQKERIPLSLSPESKQNRLDELYDYGKSKGTITYKEIMDRVSGMDLDADQLDHILETLEAYGVSVVNDTADRQVTLTEEQAADQAAEVARIEGDTHCFDLHLEQVKRAVRQWLLQQRLCPADGRILP